MTANNLPPATPATATSVVPSSFTRGLTRGVLLANGVTLLAVAVVIAALHRVDWWPAFAAAAGVAVVAAGASVAVLSMAAGRTVDWLVTYVMGASGMRLFASLFGLLVAVKAFGTPPEATAVLICLFYVVTLIVESARLHAAANAPAGDNHA